jgi:hypothetical protein
MLRALREPEIVWKPVAPVQASARDTLIINDLQHLMLVAYGEDSNGVSPELRPRQAKSIRIEQPESFSTCSSLISRVQDGLRA